MGLDQLIVTCRTRLSFLQLRFIDQSQKYIVHFNRQKSVPKSFQVLHNKQNTTFCLGKIERFFIENDLGSLPALLEHCFGQSTQGLGGHALLVSILHRISQFSFVLLSLFIPWHLGTILATFRTSLYSFFHYLQYIKHNIIEKMI